MHFSLKNDLTSLKELFTRDEGPVKTGGLLERVTLQQAVLEATSASLIALRDLKRSSAGAQEPVEDSEGALHRAHEALGGGQDYASIGGEGATTHRILAC
jgi:hypothetical protein